MRSHRRTGIIPQLIYIFSRYNGTEDTSELVLLSAHYDSRGSFGSTRAPGGDDDGSGTTSILSIARSIGTTGIRFKKNVELCLFAGEEQGLVGSRAYARAFEISHRPLSRDNNAPSLLLKQVN